MDGLVYTCQAMNLALQRSVHDAVTMNVLCKWDMLIQKNFKWQFPVLYFDGY